MNNIANDILRIKQKAMLNGIKFNHVILIDSIREFERINDVVLPEELVLFYTEVGNGCKMIDGFNLRAFEEWGISKEKVKKEFPFEEYWIWEDNPDNDLFEEVANGNIELIDIGDAQSWNIIISGKETDQMWFFTDVGIQPCAPRRSFLSWFEYWLDGNSDYFTDYL